jgi:hypothetical protein
MFGQHKKKSTVFINVANLVSERDFWSHCESDISIVQPLSAKRANQNTLMPRNPIWNAALVSKHQRPEGARFLPVSTQIARWSHKKRAPAHTPSSLNYLHSLQGFTVHGGAAHPVKEHLLFLPRRVIKMQIIMFTGKYLALPANCVCEWLSMYLRDIEFGVNY